MNRKRSAFFSSVFFLRLLLHNIWLALCLWNNDNDTKIRKSNAAIRKRRSSRKHRDAFPSLSLRQTHTKWQWWIEYQPFNERIFCHSFAFFPAKFADILAMCSVLMEFGTKSTTTTKKCSPIIFAVSQSDGPSDILFDHLDLALFAQYFHYYANAFWWHFVHWTRQRSINLKRWFFFFRQSINTGSLWGS